MRQTRRTWLSGTGTALLVGLAGCSGILGNDGGESTPEEEGTDQPSNGETATEQPAEESGMSDPDPIDAAVVAEWNAIRTRLRDPVILGHAGEFAAGASVAGHVFERFETASGEHNAHETLEDMGRDRRSGGELLGVSEDDRVAKTGSHGVPLRDDCRVGRVRVRHSRLLRRLFCRCFAVRGLIRPLFFGGRFASIVPENLGTSREGDEECCTSSTEPRTPCLSHVLG